MGELTIKDIARMAGVSHTTVSRSLNGARNVKPETYAKIMEICQQTGFTRNAAARQLKKHEAKSIGIVVPDISNAFFAELIHNIEWDVKQRGFNCFISSSFYDYNIEDQNIQALLERRVDGVIISGVGDRTYLGLQKYLDKLPILFLGDNIPDHLVSKITVDGYTGIVKGARYLLSLGHRNLAFLGGRETSLTHQRRRQAFLDVMQRTVGVKYEVFTITPGSRIEDGYQTGMAYFGRCMEKGTPCATAIMTINDHFALGTIQAAMEFGIDIPQQVSLIGFDDVAFAALPKIQLTTLAQPKEELCALAVETLMKLIGHEERKIYHEVIQPELIRRETCVPPRQKQSHGNGEEIP